MTTITAIRVEDIRFPTSQSLDGSDAMNPDPDYSAAYVILQTDNPALKAMTQDKPFKSEPLPISAVGSNMAKVQQMLDRAGFQ